MNPTTFHTLLSSAPLSVAAPPPTRTPTSKASATAALWQAIDEGDSAAMRAAMAAGASLSQCRGKRSMVGVAVSKNIELAVILLEAGARPRADEGLFQIQTKATADSLRPLTAAEMSRLHEAGVSLDQFDLSYWWSHPQGSHSLWWWSKVSGRDLVKSLETLPELQQADPLATPCDWLLHAVSGPQEFRDYVSRAMGWPSGEGKYALAHHSPRLASHFWSALLDMDDPALLQQALRTGWGPDWENPTSPDEAAPALLWHLSNSPKLFQWLTQTDPSLLEASRAWSREHPATWWPLYEYAVPWPQTSQSSRLSTWQVDIRAVCPGTGDTLFHYLARKLVLDAETSHPPSWLAVAAPQLLQPNASGATVMSLLAPAAAQSSWYKKAMVVAEKKQLKEVVATGTSTKRSPSRPRL